MKENQTATFDTFKSFRKETDPLVVGSKAYNMNGPRTDRHNSEFGVTNGDQLSNARNSVPKETQNGLLYQPISLGHGVDFHSSDTKDEDINLKHECSVTCGELEYGSEGKYGDSRLLYFAASDSLETQTDLYTELPELEICHKEMTHHIVKDIWIDEGMPVQRSPLNKSINDDRSGHTFSQTVNGDDHYEATEVDSAVECTKGVRFNECAIKGESNGELLAREKETLPPRNSSMEDTAKCCCLKDSMQKSETNIDQISSRKAVIEGPAASSSAVGPKEVTETSNLNYSNKAKSGNITLNFNSSIPVVASVTNGRTETGDVFDGNDADPKKICCNNNKEPSFGKINKPCLNVKDGFSNRLTPSNAESACSKEMIDENSHNQSPDDKDENSDSTTSRDNLQFASGKEMKEMNTTQSDDQSSELHVYKNKHRDSSNDSTLTPGKHDMGESSFSAASLIAYSGPITFSGSLSLRSDSSAATSARSFAFPILQPEWNSSPVRMSKADDGHFRKHKGWRSGILCCRF